MSCLLPVYSLYIPLWQSLLKPGHHVSSASQEAPMILLFLPTQSWIRAVRRMPGFYICDEIQNLVLLIAEQAFLIVESFLQHHIKFLSPHNRMS